MAKDKFGLRDITKDKRDLQLGALYFLPRLEDLPDSFDLKPPFPVKDQGNTDYCSAYSSCGVSELQEIVELYPEYSFALSKEISGDPDAWGQNMRDAMKAHQKYGAIDAETAQNSPKIADLRRLQSYPTEWADKALKHRKKSFFAITGQYDPFDNIRASIWKTKTAVAIGVVFSWPVGQYILNTAQQQGFGHMMYVTGWDDDGLIVVNSYGKAAGKNGKHRMTREVINTFAPRFGMMTMIDIEPDEARVIIDKREWALAGFIKKIIIIIRRLWQRLQTFSQTE